MQKIFLILIWCCLTTVIQAQETYTISGYVQDANSGEKLIGANVYDAETYEGSITNTYGFYSISLPPGSKQITFSYIGYADQVMTVDLKSDQTLVINLEPQNALEEIEIVAEKQRNIAEETSMSTIEIPILQIKKIPALLGEVDVLKALQLLPGVQSGGEGTSGLYVRGGSPDQNLILLDGVPVYNASHLFGFFSVFNSDAIKDVKLVKGGYPARYGGRLSSVLDITLKEGNMKEIHGAGSIGLISSKFMLEGPIKTDKTSFLISGRRTYADLIFKPFIKAGFASDGQGSSGDAGVFFYDLNAKLNHVFSEKDRLYLSAYAGKDKFFAEYNEKDEDYEDSYGFGFGWGNLTSALRWNHLWTPKLFSNTSLTYSRYNLNLAFSNEINDKVLDEKDEIGFSYDAGVRDVALKLDFDYYPNPNHFIRFGVSAVQHEFIPGTFNFVIKENSFDLDTTFGQKDISSQEFDLYVEDDMKITEKLKANVGVHLSGFNVQNTFYSSAQPRASLRYMIADDQSLKLSFATMAQYINLLTSEGIGLPTDLWVPTTARIKPQESWQVAAGYAFKISDDLNMTLEGYYKKMDNLVSFKEGEGLLGEGLFADSSTSELDERITQGEGTAYGMELFLQKQTGKLTGWVGYTLSWSNRQFEDINFGEAYPFRYDRRHDVSIVAQYEISDRIDIAGTWVYGTGNAVTLANSTYKILTPRGEGTSGREIEDYQEKNNFRMGAYHRMDIGINFTKEKAKHTRTWSFGAYNAYNRRNPYLLFIDNDVTYNQNNERIASKNLKAQSLFPVVPYFSYSFKF